jgi:hypothetical protein
MAIKLFACNTSINELFTIDIIEPRFEKIISYNFFFNYYSCQRRSIAYAFYFSVRVSPKVPSPTSELPQAG